ncbi:hypothetical protein OG399_42975 [Streptomyces achromogenes]
MRADWAGRPGSAYAGAAPFTGDGLRPHPVPLTAAEFRHQEAAAVAAEDVTVWDRDHQLQLVRAVLRGPRPDLRIGFFPHLPFPPVGRTGTPAAGAAVSAGPLAAAGGCQRPGRRPRTARARAVLPAVPTAPHAMNMAAVTR